MAIVEKGKLRSVFNTLSRRDKVEMTSSIGLSSLDDKRIDADLNSKKGSDTGYYGRADLSGHTEQKLKVKRKRDIEKNRDFQMILASIKFLQNAFNTSIENWTITLREQSHLNELLLDDLERVSNLIDELRLEHDVVETMLKEDTVDLNLNNITIKSILDRYNARVGLLDNVDVVSMLQDQILFEKNTILPDLQKRKSELNVLYVKNANTYDISLKQKTSIEEEWERILELPDGKEKEQLMRDILEHADIYQIELIDKIKMSQKERAVILGEITNNNDLVSEKGLEEKITDKNSNFVPLADFSFN